MTLAEQLTNERVKAGLSQQELATKAVINIDTIKRIEKGINNNPTVEVLRILGKHLNNYKFEI